MKIQFNKWKSMNLVKPLLFMIVLISSFSATFTLPLQITQITQFFKSNNDKATRKASELIEKSKNGIVKEWEALRSSFNDRDIKAIIKNKIVIMTAAIATISAARCLHNRVREARFKARCAKWEEQHNLWIAGAQKAWEKNQN